MRYQIENKKYPYFVGNMPGLGGIPHIHTHLEMVYICRGRAIATADGNSFEIGPGDLFLAFPNQIHFYEKLEPVNIYLVIFSVGIHEQLVKLLEGKLPQCPVVKKAALPEGIPERLERIARLSRAQSPYERMCATGQLLDILGQLLPLFSYRDAPADHDSVKRILGYCVEHYTEPLTLEALSRELFLSKFYISHVFTKRMGIRFPAFLGKLRVEHACQLLQRGDPITTVAFASGFSSVRTFNRIFSAEMGITPREYRKNRKA